MMVSLKTKLQETVLLIMWLQMKVAPCAAALKEDTPPNLSNM